MTGQPTEADIEAVLTAHTKRAQPYALVCACGSQWEYQNMLGRAEDRHRAHVAAALRPLLTDTAALAVKCRHGGRP